MPDALAVLVILVVALCLVVGAFAFGYWLNGWYHRRRRRNG